MSILSRKVIVPYTPAQMFRLVDDIGAYPEFLPWCEQGIIHERNEDEVKATIIIHAAGLKKSFMTHNLLKQNKMIEIRLLDGPFKHLEGFWRFDEVNTGQCNVAFDLEFEFNNKLLGLALGPVFYQMTSSMIEAFHKRAIDKYGK